MAKEIVYPALVMPETVAREKVTIWSGGVALDGDIYRPKAMRTDPLAPAVVLSHGWGGDKTTGERYAAKFAAKGMVCLCFSYAGWAGSGGQVLLTQDSEVRVIRELVDPLEWIQNFRSAVDYIAGEPGVDVNRIGAWGTSFGGGIALHNAANDERIKVLAVQVASLAPVLKGDHLAHAKQRATDIARGAIPPVPQGIDAYGQLAGTPHLARFLQYDALAQVPKLQVPVLMIDAGDEALFDIRANSGRAYEVLKAQERAPVRYEVIPGIDHYGVYFAGFEQSSESALSWFSRHL